MGPAGRLIKKTSIDDKKGCRTEAHDKGNKSNSSIRSVLTKLKHG